MEDTKTDTSDFSGRLGEDGKTDTYFGGEGKADGPGHGHVATNEQGEHEYVRDSEANMPGSDRSERVSVDDRK